MQHRNNKSIATGLNRRYFVSREIFAEESRQIFSGHWLCLGHEDELFDGCHGSTAFHSCTVQGTPIFVLRFPDAHPLAFHNVCRHRGAQLVQAERGNIDKSCITCPYHAWTYDCAGQLIGAPNMMDVAEFDRGEFSLLSAGCANWHGLVMINLEKSRGDFHKEFRPLNDRQQNWLETPWQLAKTLQYEVAANWKLIFQNYSECYHCPTVHPDLNRLTPYKSATNDLLEGAILGGPMQLDDGYDTVSRDGKLIGPRFPHLSADQQRHVYYYTVFPNMFVSAHPDYVMLHRLDRLATDRTFVTCQFFVPQGAESDIAAAAEIWDQVNRQDWHVCELTQRGVQSPAFQPGPYSSLESMLAALDSHYLSVLQPHDE